MLLLATMLLFVAVGEQQELPIWAAVSCCCRWHPALLKAAGAHCRADGRPRCIMAKSIA
jgi:hypothetical protein